MSLIVQWEGRDYDLDLTGYSGRDLDALEQRTGETWRWSLVGMCSLKPNAVRSPFWLTDRRENPDLKWSEYDGPPVSVVMPHVPALRGIVDAVGKAIIPPQVPDTGGSDDSPSTVDIPPDSSTT